MDILSLLISVKHILIFTAVLSVLIVVHEWGHFITAKKLGVTVERFALGFGPKIFSRKINGTEFMLCLIPLGGYVKMAGDERGNLKGSSDEFYSKPPGHRALIVLNGPVVNMILAYVCLVFVFILGYPDLSNKIGKILADYPGAQAGLRAEDKVIEINKQKMETWTDVQTAISTSQGEVLHFVLIRNGETMEIIVTPRVEERKNIFGQIKATPLVGIVPKEEVTVLTYPVQESFVRAGKKLWEITMLTYKSLYYMVTGSMSAKDSVTGPIGIFYIVKSAAEMGFSHLLYIVGIISASLAIFNLLPIIPLDGGHLLLFGIERVRGRVLSEKIDEAIARVGFSLIICLAVFVFYSDFARFGLIDKVLGWWR